MKISETIEKHLGSFRKRPLSLTVKPNFQAETKSKDKLKSIYNTYNQQKAIFLHYKSLLKKKKKDKLCNRKMT